MFVQIQHHQATETLDTCIIYTMPVNVLSPQHSKGQKTSEAGSEQQAWGTKAVAELDLLKSKC
jgi:hypothetical protein